MLYGKLKGNAVNIFEGEPSLQGSNNIVPFVIISDQGFGLPKSVLQPYRGKYLSVKKRVFMHYLSRTRGCKCVRCTFKILANKWITAHRPLDVSVDFAEGTVN
jgi:hypothetical protein